MDLRWLTDAPDDDGVTVDSSRKSEVTRGVVLPLVVLVVIFALGIVTGQHAVFIAMMAAVPMLSAVFASVPFVALVAVVTFVAGLVLTFVPADEATEDSLVPMVALIVLAAIAVIVEPVPRLGERRPARRRPSGASPSSSSSRPRPTSTP